MEIILEISTRLKSIVSMRITIEIFVQITDIFYFQKNFKKWTILKNRASLYHSNKLSTPDYHDLISRSFWLRYLTELPVNCLCLDRIMTSLTSIIWTISPHIIQLMFELQIPLRVCTKINANCNSIKKITNSLQKSS